MTVEFDRPSCADKKAPELCFKREVSSGAFFELYQVAAKNEVEKFALLVVAKQLNRISQPHFILQFGIRLSARL